MKVIVFVRNQVNVVRFKSVTFTKGQINDVRFRKVKEMERERPNGNRVKEIERKQLL